MRVDVGFYWFGPFYNNNNIKLKGSKIFICGIAVYNSAQPMHICLDYSFGKNKKKKYFDGNVYKLFMMCQGIQITNRPPVYLCHIYLSICLIPIMVLLKQFSDFEVHNVHMNNSNDLIKPLLQHVGRFYS